MFTGMDEDNKSNRFWDDDKHEVEDWLAGRGSVVMAVFAILLVLAFVVTFAQDLL